MKGRQDAQLYSEGARTVEILRCRPRLQPRGRSAPRGRAGRAENKKTHARIVDKFVRLVCQASQEFRVSSLATRGVHRLFGRFGVHVVARRCS